MNNKHILFLCVLSIMSFSSCEDNEVSPEYDEIFVKHFGGFEIQEGYDFVETNDGGFAVLGSTNSFGAGSTDAYLIKVDRNGEEEWSKTFGDSDADQGKSIRVDSDGGYLILGDFTDVTTGKSNIKLIKTDRSGESLWESDYSLFNRNTMASDLELIPDGFIVIGSTDSVFVKENTSESNPIFDQNDTQDMLSWKFNSQGTAWSNFYGLRGTDEGVSIIPLNNGNSVILGTSEEETSSIGRTNITLKVIDSNGIELRSQSIGSSETFEFAKKIIKGIDSYFVLGEKRPNRFGKPQLVLYRVGLEIGENNFSQELTVQDNSIMDELSAEGILELPDQNILVLGTGKTISNALFVEKQIYIYKINPFGEVIWEQNYGGTNDDLAHAITVTSDGNIAVLGTTNFGNENRLISLIKLNQDGELK